MSLSSFGTFVAAWFGRQTPKQKSKLNRRAKLSVETMEDRITPAVQLDPAFGTAGKVLTDLQANPNSYEEALAVTIQPDGKILTTGYGGYLVRLNSDGSFDRSFANSGKAMVMGRAMGVAIDSQERIVVVGEVSNGNATDLFVSRYYSDGSLDESFDGDGNTIIKFGLGYDGGSGVAIDVSGRIVVGGYTNDGANDGTRNEDFAVARLNIDGSLDSTFGVNGKVVTSLSVGIDRLTSLAVDSSGRIVAGGYSHNGWYDDFALVRYTENGILDSSFNNNGMQFTDFGNTDDQLSAIRIDASGRIVAAGYRNNGNSDFAVARYNPDGTLDATFSSDGKATAEFGTPYDIGTSLAFDRDGRIVVGGFVGNDVKQDFALARFQSDGTLDSTFDGDGKLTLAIGSRFDRINAVALDHGGRIVVAGSTFGTPSWDIAMARFEASGTLDSSFGVSGKLSLAFGASTDVSGATAVDASGRVVMVGTSSDKFVLARYHPDGDLDATFGKNGLVATDVGSNEMANGIAIDSLGRIIVVGQCLNNGTWDYVIVRYNPDGTLDTTFDGDGKRTASIGSSYDYANGVAIDSSDRIVVVGESYNGSSGDFSIARFNVDGSFDSSFHGDGAAIVSFGSSDDWATSVAIDDAGRIIVAGRSGSVGFALVRFNPDGSLDSSFDGDGKISSFFASSANDIAIDSAGRIVVAGYANWDFAVARYNVDGSPDASFGSNGRVVTPVGSSIDVGRSVAIDALGHIVVAGYAKFGENFDFSVVRYRANGSLDLEFDGDGIFSAPIGRGPDIALTVHIDAIGRILVSGHTGQGADDDFALARFVETELNVPIVPGMKLVNDTGINGDRITFDGRFRLRGVYQGATVEYSIDGLNWSSAFTPVEGVNSVRVRQTDSNNNTSVASNPFVFTLDTSAPQVTSLASVAPDPRNVPLTFIDVLFSESIDLATFNYADLVLQRDGGSNLIGAASGVSIAATANPNLYRIQLPSTLTASSGNYVLKVNAAGITDLAGNAATNDVQSSWATNANGVLGVPTFASPLGAVNDATPTIAWSAVTYAGKYDLWVDNLTTGASQVIRQQNLTGTSFTPSANLPFGSYRMWIRAFNGAGTPGAWSAGADFRIAAPTVTGPVGTASSDTPTITWSAVDGAARYDLWVDNVSTGASQVMRRSDLTTNSATPASPLAAGVYRVWVRALDAAGNSTAWSAASDFTVGIPTVTGPVGTAPSSTPTIAWTALSNVSRYDLWVDNLTTGASPVIRQQTLVTNSFDVTTPLSSGQYRVWVRAFSLNGAASPWSKAFDFVVGIPTVTAPIGGGQTTTPTFSWMAVPNAVRYDLWVDNLTTGQSQAIRQTALTATTYTPTSSLAAGQSYRVWVRSFDAQNRASVWSIFADFTISNVI
jgi:uncharacterized delta-60 repeat protein